jgi:hypothetical protein
MVIGYPKEVGVDRTALEGIALHIADNHVLLITLNTEDEDRIQASICPERITQLVVDDLDRDRILTETVEDTGELASIAETPRGARTGCTSCCSIDDC